MYQSEVFEIVWRTGHMKLSVGDFFGKANQNIVKKLFRTTTRKFCTEEQRLELIQMIQSELKKRENLLDSLEELESRREQMLDGYVTCVRRPLGTAEKELKKQCERIENAISLLKEERW